MIVMGLLLPMISLAGDRVTFISGQTVNCTVIEYIDGIIRVIDQEGRERSAPIEQIQRIVFEQPKQTVPDDLDSTEDKALTPAEVLANINRLEGEMVEIVGHVMETDSAFGIASHHNFVIILEQDLRVKMARDTFRSQYFELKEIRNTPHNLWPDRYPYYEIRFSGDGRLISLIEKRQEVRYTGGRTRQRERIVGTERILDGGESIRIHGLLQTTGSRVYVENTRLLAIE